MPEIYKRIQILMDNNQLKPAEFARALGEKLQRIQDIQSGKQRVPEDVLIKIVEIFNVDGTWLLTGQGTMHVKNTISEESPSSLINNIMKNLTKHQQRTLLGIAQEMLLVRKMAEKLGEKLDEEI